ncbi:MAG: MraY family glycosyltransferase [Desulfuromonadales bacterium]
MLQHFYIFITALFASLIMVPLLRRWALDSGVVDQPDERKVHKEATPRVGGIAIAISFLFALLAHAEINTELRGILAGTLVMFLTGMVDDLHGISPRKKFLGEIAACLVTIFVGDLHIIHLGNLLGTGNIILPLWLSYPFTVFAVVGLINAINLIDGLDGLAGGVSVIALVTFGLLGFITGNTVAMLISAGLFGALLGFLKYNFYPARIFMGDAGSLSIGFVLGFLAISLTQSASSVTSPIIPAIVLGLPIIDTLWVMSRRVIHGVSPFSPDRTHVHHQFLDLGFNHRFTVLIIYVISLYWSIIAILFRRHSDWLLLLIYLGLSGSFYIALRYILKHRERFQSLLALDSSKSIFQSRRFGKLTDALAFLESALIVLIIAYFSLAAWFGTEANNPTIQVAALLLAASIVLIYYARDVRNDYVLLAFYFAGLVFTYQIALLPNIDQGDLLIQNAANLLSIALAILVVLRLLLRRPGTLFLSTPDYLILGLNILFAVFISQSVHDGMLPWVLVKGVVLYLAIKLVMVDPRPRVRTLAWFLLGFVGVMIVRGLLF